MVYQRGVYQRKIHTIDELKQRLIEVWCDLEQLELVFVRREDTSNIVFELNDCLDFVNFCHLLCHVLLEFCIAE